MEKDNSTDYFEEQVLLGNEALMSVSPVPEDIAMFLKEAEWPDDSKPSIALELLEAYEHGDFDLDSLSREGIKMVFDFLAQAARNLRGKIEINRSSGRVFLISSLWGKSISKPDGERRA